MKKHSIFIRIVSIILAVTFITGQISAGQISSSSSDSTLAASVISDDINLERSSLVRPEIAKIAQPGAIGKGMPLLELMQKLPPEATFPGSQGSAERTVIEKALFKRIHSAIEICVKKQGEVRRTHLERFAKALDNLIDLRDRLSQRAYLYNADVRAAEDYLLGFYSHERYGLAIDFMEWVEERHIPDLALSNRLIAQYIVRLCIPGKGIITKRDDPETVYDEILSDVFGEDEVIALKEDSREFINEKANKTPTIGAGQVVSKISPSQIKIGNTIIGIIQGDITQVPAEAVVPGVNALMNVGAGITGAIIGVVGRENAGKVFPSPKAVIGKNAFNIGDVYVASLDNIQTPAGWKYVISAIIHTGSPWDNPTEEGVITSIKNALIKAGKRGVKSITFPAFSMDISEMDFNVSARSMCAGIGEFLAENPETSLRDIKIVLSGGPAVAPFRQELMKFAEFATYISPEQAEIKSKLASLKDVTLKIVKVIAKAGQADVMPIIELARQIYPDFDPYISENQWLSVTPEEFIILNSALKYQIFLPNNEIFDIVRISARPDVIRGKIKEGSWRYQGYLGSIIWIAESSPTEEGYSTTGLAAGWFAVINSDYFREAGKKEYKRLKDSIVSSGGIYASPYAIVIIPLIETARIEEEDYVEGIFVEHERQKAIKYAQDKAYTAQMLRRDNRFSPDEDGQTVREILKRDSILAQKVLKHSDQQSRNDKAAAILDWQVDLRTMQVGLRTIVEYSASLGGAIAEIKKHLDDGQEQMAYLAFLNFMENQYTDYTPEQISSDNILQSISYNVADLFFEDIDKWADTEVWNRASSDIINMLIKKYKEMPIAKKALMMLEGIYAKHFWTDEERLARLSSEPFELSGPFLANHSERTFAAPAKEDVTKTISDQKLREAAEVVIMEAKYYINPDEPIVAIRRDGVVTITATSPVDSNKITFMLSKERFFTGDLPKYIVSIQHGTLKYLYGQTDKPEEFLEIVSEAVKSERFWQINLAADLLADIVFAKIVEKAMDKRKPGKALAISPDAVREVIKAQIDHILGMPADRQRNLVFINSRYLTLFNDFIKNNLNTDRQVYIEAITQYFCSIDMLGMIDQAIRKIDPQGPEGIPPQLESGFAADADYWLEMANSFVQISENMPVHAKEFAFNLTKILADNPGQLFFVGIETRPDDHQQTQTMMPLYLAVEKIQNLKDDKGDPLFPNLIMERGSAAKLAETVSNLNKVGDGKGKKLDLNNTFIGAREASVKDSIYKNMNEGGAWIAAVNDSIEGDYLPVFEAITLNMMAYLKADLLAIKNFYDAISDKPKSLGELQDMIKNRIIYILPKATKFDAEQLRKLYELAKTAYTSA